MAKRRKQFQTHSGVEKAFGVAMRKLREKLGISQLALQTKTGLDRTFISDLERGVQCPSLRTVIRVAKGLNTTADRLTRLTTQSPYFVFPTSEGGP